MNTDPSLCKQETKKYAFFPIWWSNYSIDHAFSYKKILINILNRDFVNHSHWLDAVKLEINNKRPGGTLTTWELKVFF